MTRLRAIDLFCGAGGSSWGAREAGVDIVAAFDCWALAGKVHQDNFPTTQFYAEELRNLDVGELARAIGSVDMILASPECTNHSPAKGNKPRCEESKNTAFEVIRFARAFQPRWVVIENVVSMRKWSRYAEFKRELSDLGYQMHEEVLNAADFGVPQSRRRLFLLCDREQEPQPTPKLGGRLPKQASSVVQREGDWQHSLLKSPGRAKATLERAARATKALGKKETFLLVYYGSDAAGGWQSLNRPLRTITTVDRFALVQPHADGQIMRMLQVPELKAAMGMPTDFKFEHGTRRERIKMMGNAVCPPVMEQVVKSLKASVPTQPNLQPRASSSSPG